MKFDIDLTLQELKNLQTVKHLGPIFEQLYKEWVGEIKHRENDVRIGSMTIYKDWDGYLHMDFRTRYRTDASDHTV